ncbi:ovochymase-2-like isoform X2 [Mercenaria mercenaria]|uniref:ovochymase-2-like isoform X2 n=1 Tax=Mercenaria mercenaria TaxID=6596 RepID=UPI00234F6D1B|nr:ovochymase-2-like isoform X2 [Mercenaria mercenaria]
MMGFESGKARFDISSNANKSLPILLDDVKCSGNESTLSDCTHNDWGIHDCAYTEVAAIECFDNRHTKHIDVLSNYDCGKIPLKGLKRKKRQSRIVGGFEAIKGMHPWQVGIQRLRKRWIRWCGGTIISSHWILSAAHCFDDLSRQKDGRDAKMNYEDVRVYIGDHDWTEHDEYEQIFQIEYLVKHWQYSDREYPPKHDVALLKIRSKSGDGAVFNDYVQPACLPGENDRLYYEMKCEISGWGRRAENGTTSNVLMSVEVPIVDERKCEEFYKHYNIDLQKVFCAGDVIIGTDTCHGDSGGPFVCDINETNTVTGITSWGDGCGRPDALGVYTNVAVYVSWIKEQISRHDLVERCDPDDLSNAVVKDKKGERIRTKIPSGTEVYLSCQYGYEYYSDGQPMDKPVIRECVKGTIINAPDCEKTVVYLISVKTAYYILFGEGTDANVYITLHGLRGETEKMYLEGSFEAGNLDETRVKAKDVRPVTSVVIGHDGSGSYPDWLLEYVSIYVDNMKEYYVFRHNDWVKAERDVRLHRQVLDQQTCIDSFDSGHKWWPRWSSIRSEDKYNISSHRRMSLRACKQACINLQDMQCKAVMYSNDHKSCYGLAVSDTSYFTNHRTWNSPVYLRTCKQFD